MRNNGDFVVARWCNDDLHLIEIIVELPDSGGIAKFHGGSHSAKRTPPIQFRPSRSVACSHAANAISRPDNGRNGIKRRREAATANTDARSLFNRHAIYAIVTITNARLDAHEFWCYGNGNPWKYAFRNGFDISIDISMRTNFFFISLLLLSFPSSHQLCVFLSQWLLYNYLCVESFIRKRIHISTASNSNNKNKIHVYAKRSLNTFFCELEIRY